MMMTRSTTLAGLLFVAAGSTQLPAQEKKINLGGRWTINTARSNYDRMPLPKSYVEVIDHKEPNLTISTTSEDQRGEAKTFMKLTTDDRENLNDINGNEFHSKSHWDDGKLITTVTGDRGLRMVEVRSLSLDGKTQTVETYMGEIRGAPQITRVMERSAR
jgi:hypothetical protein